MPDVAYSKSRAKLMRFISIPALFSWSELYSNQNTQILSIESLENKRIAVLKGSIQETFLTQWIHNLHVKNVHLVRVHSLTQAFVLAKTGQVNAAVANNFFGDNAAPKYDLQGTPIIFQEIPLYFVTPPGREMMLRNTINKDLAQWESNPQSQYYKILNRWKVHRSKFIIPTFVWWVMGLLGILLMVSLVVMLVMRIRALGKIRQLAFYDTLTGLANRA